MALDEPSERCAFSLSALLDLGPIGLSRLRVRWLLSRGVVLVR